VLRVLSKTTDSKKKETRGIPLPAMASVTVLPTLSQSWVAPDSPAAKSLARKSHL